MIRRLFPVATVTALLVPAVLVSTLLASALVAPGLVAPASAAPYPTPQLQRWTPAMKIAAGRTSRTWTSPWVRTSAGRALLPSWNVSTMPDGTWLMVYARVGQGSTTSRWKTVAQWRHGLAGGKRTTYGAQKDALAWVDTDTVRARTGRTFDRWQLRVVAKRSTAKKASPVLRAVAGVASSYTSKVSSTSATTMTRTVDLAVPAYSQMVHRGHFPKYGGGGEAWCSPTSTAMVLRYYGLGPRGTALRWATGADPQVDHAARYSYDSAYRGTGTWPFNTAYASRFGTDAVVHRLPDLRAVERYIGRGVPVIASVAFGRGQLSGSPISSTPGHLIVVRGFTAAGDVIVNDPAGRTNSQVRRVYRRAQFERAWLPGSGGVVYVIAPTRMRLTF